MIVLCVDDSGLIRRMVQRALQPLSVNLLESGDGLDALERVTALGDRLDLILLDWNLPGADGLTILQKIKGTDGLRRIPVIMMSSMASPQKIREATSVGAADFIRKPFTADDLLERVRQVLARSPESRETHVPSSI